MKAAERAGGCVGSVGKSSRLCVIHELSIMFERMFMFCILSRQYLLDLDKTIQIGEPGDRRAVIAASGFQALPCAFY